jgi:C-terminal processing protease CtpA/Prc
MRCLREAVVKLRSVVGSIAAAIFLIGGAITCGASDETEAEPRETFAGDIVGLAKLLADRHYEPPAQQQVILLAARALHKARKSSPPRDLTTRCSKAASDEELTAVLTEACGPQFQLDTSVRAELAGAIAGSVPGGLQLLSKKTSTAQQQLTENRYVGVGIAAALSETRELAITTVLPGGPMAKAGIPDKTIIRTVDGRATKDHPLEDSVDWLRGPEGTRVDLTLLRPGSTTEEPLTLYRGVVPQTMLDVQVEETSGRRIAILKPKQLGGSLAHEIRKFADSQQTELDGILLDLRGTYGPAHFAALVADQFLDGGDIGAARNGSRRVPMKAEPGELFPDIPLAVATDESTRGSAAWLATVLGERKRAAVFGQKRDRPNLDYETFDLPSGEEAVLFATKILDSPGGASTLVVTEQTQAELPYVVDAVTAAESSLKKLMVLSPAPAQTWKVDEQMAQQQVVAKELRRALIRNSFVVAKEYLENLPARKG